MLKNKTLNNISFLVGGTAIAQVITFFGMLYLTKIYSPESFGILSLGTSAVSLLAPLATMRYDKAIILAPDEKETKGLLFICFFLAILLFSLLLLLGSIIFLLDILNNEKHNILLILVPLGVLFFGFKNSFQMYFEKRSRFKLTSSVAILDATSKLSFQHFINNIFPVLGMLFGYIASLFFDVSFYLIKSRSIFKKSFFNQKRDDLINTCKKYKKFPKYFTWSNIIDSASQNICSLTFPLFFSLSTLGNFSLAYKIVRLPALLVGMATRRIYYPKANDLYKNNISSFISSYKKGTIWLFVISVIPVILFEFFAEYIFNLLFNPEWKSAIVYAKIVLIYVFFNFFNSLAHENMVIFGLQKKFLIIELIWFILSFSLIYLAYFLEKPTIAVLFYTFSGITMEIMVFLSSLHKIKDLSSKLRLKNEDK